MDFDSDSPMSWILGVILLDIMDRDSDTFLCCEFY